MDQMLFLLIIIQRKGGRFKKRTWFLGIKSEAIMSDTDFESSQNLINEVEKFSKIDVLINNADAAKDNLLMRMSEEDFDKVIAVNISLYLIWQNLFKK